MWQSGLASFIALTFSLVFNKWIKKRTPKWMTHILVPFCEEFFKTFSAINLVADLRHVHLFFGCGEAVYEFLKNRKISWLVWPFDILAHAFFGLLTYTVFHKYGSVLMAVFISGTVHCLWNGLVYRFSANNKGGF